MMNKIFQVFYIVILSFFISSCHESDNRISENNGVNLYKAKQYEMALPLLEKAANAGDPQAPFYLGIMFDEGSGVIKDQKKSFEWFEKAAKNGNTDAFFVIGSRYLYGSGVEKDYKEALKWYKRSVEEGKKDDKTIYFMIGSMYYNGLGTLKDTSEAAKWYEKAAEKGDAFSQAMLAMQYYSGQGILTNMEKARYWAEKSAEQDYDAGQMMMGILSQYGTPEPDMKAAIDWYEKAARQGNPIAQFLLTRSYENGNGVPKDLEKAHAYYKQAAGGMKSDDLAREFMEFEARQKRQK